MILGTAIKMKAQNSENVIHCLLLEPFRLDDHLYYVT